MSKFNIPFIRYKKNMLPDGYQDEDVEEFIEDNAKRVVRITYKTSYGSGIVFKLGDQLCILTNYHVIRKANPNYRKIGINIGGQVWKIESYWGGCKRHDMALLELSRGPDPLRSLPIPGINQLVVEITVDGECFKGLVEYHRGEGRYVVHALKFSERRLDDDIEVVCKFMKVKKPAICRMRDVCYCSETGCAIIFIDSQILPKKVKSMFESQKFWETVQNPLVVVLSHPLGDVKHISTGNVMQEESDKNGFPQFKPAKNVCFKIEGDHDKCQFGNSVGISKSPSQQRSCPVDQQSASNPRIYSPTTERKSNKHADEFVRKDIGPHSGTQYFFVNNNGERVKFPTIEDVTSYFSCSGHDTKNSPVNRDDNRKYFYATEGRVYCSTTNGPPTEILSRSEQFFKVTKNGNTVSTRRWTDREINPIHFPLLEETRVGYLNKDINSSIILGFNVYSIQDKVYFEGKIEDDPDSVYFLVGRDGIVIRRDYEDKDMFVQTDMNGNKGFFKLDSEGNKMCVYEPEKNKFLLEEDSDGTRVYIKEAEDDKIRYFTVKVQEFQKDQDGNRIFRRIDANEDHNVYYGNRKGKNNPFQIDSEHNMVYLQIDYNNKQLYAMKDDNGDDKFVEIHKVIHLNHNAETSPGSSGGCVLVIGKDEKHEYRCLVCMHKGKTDKPYVNKAIVFQLGK